MANQKITDEMRIAVTMARFAPMFRGDPPLSYDELEKKFHLSERSISKAISEAFKAGLVKLVPSVVPQYNRNRGLEDKILSQYEFLRSVVVIDTTQGTESDDIHRALGHAAATLIANTPAMIRRRDVIGVGKGRGVYYTIESLRQFPPNPEPDITIMSLTGSTFPRRISGRSEYLVDADANARNLAGYFTSAVQISPVSHPMAHASESDRNIARDQTWLSDTMFARYVPVHAVVGLGMLMDVAGNRLVQEVKSDAPTSPVLTHIHDETEELVTLVEKLAQLIPGYCAVADICNYLFFVPPANVGGSEQIRNLEKRTQEIIEIINSRILTATTEQMRKIDNVMLVAGTHYKAEGIKATLKDKGIVNMLFTDRDAANAILR